jgi:hypothetical protein
LLFELADGLEVLSVLVYEKPLLLATDFFIDPIDVSSAGGIGRPILTAA